MGYYIKCTREQMELVLYDEWTKGSLEKLINEGTIIEVTEPHGRLIDADKQHKRLQKQVMALYSEKSDKYSYLMDVLYSIHREPTVIEAEGK